MADLPVGPELVALATEAISYGVHIADGKQPFQPAMMTETPAGARNLTQLVLVKSDDVLADVRARLAEVEDVQRAALIMDGNLQRSGRTVDAIIVQVGERGGPGYEFVQQYRRRRFGKGVTREGNIGFAGERPALFD